MKDINHILNILPVHIIDARLDKEESVAIGEELESLITTLGGKIPARTMQKIERPDNATYIGKGKVQEVMEIIKEENIDVVVLSVMAKPRQIHALKSAFHKANPKIDVWDRVDLILHIFEKHATTTEAKLQIELARMRYMGPRIYGMGFVLSRQGGGIGTSGIGETNTELMKRHWRAEMKKVTDQLDKISTTRMQQIDHRKRSGYKTVSLVGYTNAGKSALFKVLTGKDVLVEDALFATLDSNIGKHYLPALQQEILITDTIGFIRSLPPRLIDAFKSTLLESINADILLHVVDISDPQVDTKIMVVTTILQELGRESLPMQLVFNKIDAAQHLVKPFAEKYKEFAPLFVSAATKNGIDTLLDTVEKRLSI
jgi:GTPase